MLRCAASLVTAAYTTSTPHFSGLARRAHEYFMSAPVVFFYTISMVQQFMPVFCLISGYT
jgi:hypothetical protein